jgi:hypothetical protein
MSSTPVIRPTMTARMCWAQLIGPAPLWRVLGRWGGRGVASGPGRPGRRRAGRPAGGGGGCRSSAGPGRGRSRPARGPYTAASRSLAAQGDGRPGRGGLADLGGVVVEDVAAGQLRHPLLLLRGGLAGTAAPLPCSLGGLPVAAAAELVPTVRTRGDPPAMQQVQGEGGSGRGCRGRWPGRVGSGPHPMTSSRLVVRQAGTGHDRPGLTAHQVRTAGRR